MLEVDLNLLKAYAEALIEKIPLSIYEAVWHTFLIVLIIAIFRIGWRRGIRISSGFFVVEYFFLILCSTVFFRNKSEYGKIEMTPFWTYHEIAAGDNALLMEIILTVILFIPFGLMLSITIGSKGLWKVLIFGVCTSCTVEVLQFFFRRGLCEIDDVIHNTLGCIIGITLYVLLYSLMKTIYGFSKTISREVNS